MPERASRVWKGRCHCGAVQFQVKLPTGLEQAQRCNCSICRMRGAVVVGVDLHDLEMVAGEPVLAEYRFNTGAARHHFCSICGVYTHHQQRSNPHRYGVNVACLEGVSPFDFDEVPVWDGTNHSSDGGPSRYVGVVRYESLV